jgi:hypothetical protein
LYDDVDNCNALQGGLIIAEDNSDGEHTLKRGDDTLRSVDDSRTLIAQQISEVFGE